MSTHSAPSPDRPWRVAITGASGLIGSALARTLEREGHAVVRIVRGEAGPGEIRWDPATGEIDRELLQDVSAVVNLAGENIGQRWTPEVKDRIHRSRIQGTRLIAETLASLDRPPDVLVNASAVGYYGDRGDEILSERSSPGSGFLADTVRDWEAATAPAADAGIRVVLPRFGVVLSPDGGALARLLLPFRLGAGGRLGNGMQWMSWVAIHDLVDAIRFLIGTHTAIGAVNVVAPNPVTNADFTTALGSELHRPTLFPVPKTAMRAIFGEMADETIFASQRVSPERLGAAGFQFRYPQLPQALRAVLESPV